MQQGWDFSIFFSSSVCRAHLQGGMAAFCAARFVDSSGSEVHVFVGSCDNRRGPISQKPCDCGWQNWSDALNGCVASLSLQIFGQRAVFESAACRITRSLPTACCCFNFGTRVTCETGAGSTNRQLSVCNLRRSLVMSEDLFVAC